MEQDQPTTPATEPAQQNAFPSASEKIAPSNYALIGGLIGLGIIALGAWYMMMDSATPTDVSGTPAAPEIVVTPPPATEPADSATAQMKSQGTSDDLAAIEADMRSTSTDSLNDVNKI